MLAYFIAVVRCLSDYCKIWRGGGKRKDACMQALSEAAFWTPAQAAFLREEILNDADWAEVIDQLNAELHVQK